MVFHFLLIFNTISIAMPFSSSHHSFKSYSFSNSDIDQVEWVESMRKSIVQPDDDDIGKIPVSIFTVPKILLATDPKCYIPQEVALGPFHHWRPEVYDMQRYKLAAARRIQKQVNLSFDRIVEIMKKNDEARIRACYHKFLDMSGDALIWMMAVDMAFLLEFLQVYAMRVQGRVLTKVTSGMSHLVDASGKKLSHMAILRDVVMVENQIPLFMIKKMLEAQRILTAHELTAEQTIKTMLMGLYHELSPFQERELPDVDINVCDHLLDFLYHMTVPNRKELGFVESVIDVENEDDITEIKDGEEEKDGSSSFANHSDVRRFMDFIWAIISKSNKGLVALFKQIIFSKPMMLLTKLPWKIISSLPILKLLKQPVENMFKNFRGKIEKKSGHSTLNSKPPSVTQMAKAGILFLPVHGGILDIDFDTKTSTLSLPVINLDVNSEVYLRNLVAYEACVTAGPLVVARYTELMNGIIDTEEDVKLLGENGIVLNHLKSDKEVADLWNGMSKSVKLTKVPKMDKVIEDVNKRYSRTWKVKLSKFINTYVFESWKVLTLFAALFMLFLTTLQDFCSMYSCARVLHHLPKVQGSEGVVDYWD